MIRIIRSIVALAAGWLLAAGTLVPAGAQRGQISGTADADNFEVLQLRPNFYMIAGAGANIGVQVGVDGVVVVDAGSAPRSAAVLAAIKKITAQPIRYV